MLRDDPIPKHRSGGNVCISKLSSPSKSLIPTDEFDSNLRARRAESEDSDISPAKTQSIEKKLSLTPAKYATLITSMAFIFLAYNTSARWSAREPQRVSEYHYQNLSNLCEERLRNIAKGISSLDSLTQLVLKADETYENVYHSQLVQRAKETRDPNEIDWNGFVQEARQTGPVFMEGKEKLRDTVSEMHRLIRRAPEHLRSMVHWLSKQNSEEASWYLSKVVRLVDSVHSSIQDAAALFANAEATMVGMMEDAKENANHFEHQASHLEGEVEALERSPATNSGRWSRESRKAFYGCQLETLRLPLADCKMKCVNHESGSCTRVTYYKMATRRNCYLHCETSAPGNYDDADAYTLEHGPLEFAAEMQQKTHAVHVAVGFKARWRDVRIPLREVTQLVRRFRGATSDLRGSLEDARFVTDDLMAAFKPLQVQDMAMKEEKRIRMLERRVEDVIVAIEDLGDSLALLRFQA